MAGRQLHFRGLLQNWLAGRSPRIWPKRDGTARSEV